MLLLDIFFKVLKVSFLVVSNKQLLNSKNKLVYQFVNCLPYDLNLMVIIGNIQMKATYFTPSFICWFNKFEGLNGVLFFVCSYVL